MMTLRPPYTRDATFHPSPAMLLATLGHTDTRIPVPLPLLRRKCKEEGSHNHILARSSPGTNAAGVTSIYCTECGQFGNVATSDLGDTHIFPWQERD